MSHRRHMEQRRQTCMNNGTNDGSWKYNSILSPSVSREVGENICGPSILLRTPNGVMTEYFSFICTLDERQRRRSNCSG